MGQRAVTEWRTFHPLGSDDLDTLDALEAASPVRTWTRALLDEELRYAGRGVVGAFDGEAMVGYVAARQLADEMWVLNLHVHASRRRRGWGKQLLAAVFQRTSDNGADAVWLEVRASNAPALRLYEAVGFHKVARRPRYYPLPSASAREDAIIMCRPCPRA